MKNGLLALFLCLPVLIHADDDLLQYQAAAPTLSDYKSVDATKAFELPDGRVRVEVFVSFDQRLDEENFKQEVAEPLELLFFNRNGDYRPNIDKVFEIEYKHPGGGADPYLRFVAVFDDWQAFEDYEGWEIKYELHHRDADGNDLFVILSKVGLYYNSVDRTRPIVIGGRIKLPHPEVYSEDYRDEFLRYWKNIKESFPYRGYPDWLMEWYEHYTYNFLPYFNTIRLFVLKKYALESSVTMIFELNDIVARSMAFPRVEKYTFDYLSQIETALETRFHSLGVLFYRHSRPSYTQWTLDVESGMVDRAVLILRKENQWNKDLIRNSILKGLTKAYIGFSRDLIEPRSIVSDDYYLKELQKFDYLANAESWNQLPATKLVIRDGVLCRDSRKANTARFAEFIIAMLETEADYPDSFHGGELIEDSTTDYTQINVNSAEKKLFVDDDPTTMMVGNLQENQAIVISPLNEPDYGSLTKINNQTIEYIDEIISKTGVTPDRIFVQLFNERTGAQELTRFDQVKR